MANKHYPKEVKDKARLMYIEHYHYDEIREALELPNTRIIDRWRVKGKWDDYISHEDLTQATAKRILRLIDLPKKTEMQLQELDKQGDLLLKLAKVKDIEENGQRRGRGKARSNQDGGGKPKVGKNDVSHITQQEFDNLAKELLFTYQEKWRSIGKDSKIRDRWLLKSRQIGGTFYFAFESFERACMTGNNQIFLSASRRQSEVFRAEIIVLAQKYFDIDLTGNPIVLNPKSAKPTKLMFLSNNSKTAQSEHGDVIIDEFFYINKFDDLYKLASPMASQNMYRTTCLSTPSALSHPAYKYWSGQHLNKGRPKSEHISLDVSHKALKAGRYDESDGFWRQIVTIHDAVDPKQEKPCDRLDVEYLRKKYSPAHFKNLYEGKFIDDSQSVFSLKKLLGCGVDETFHWKGFKPDSQRPYGNRPVLLGYDPSRNRDNAEVVALSEPVDNKDIFRLLDRMSFDNVGSSRQTNKIKKWCDERFNVVHIGIDRTGIGIPVFDNVEEFFPLAIPFNYSTEVKTRLVHKALDVIESHRFEYPAHMTDVPLAFMTIRQTVTQNGQMTYVSDRTEESGHGDVAWAAMMGMAKEPLNINYQRYDDVAFSD